MKTETSNSMSDSNTDEDNKKRYLATKKEEEEEKMKELIWKIYFSEENLERPSFFIEDCGD